MGESSGDGLRFNVLGPLEVWCVSERCRLGGPIQERVLVTLLLEAGKVLPVSRLVAAAWNEDPPATASHQVRKAVADLRRRIPGGEHLLVTHGPGYRVELSDGQLDLSEFNALVAGARNAASAGRVTEAVHQLRTALNLWRGAVLGGAGGPLIEAAATALTERRVTAAEQLFELRLELGEGPELVADLREFVSQHPLRETLRGHLMLALYRSQRQAEALEEYRKARELLVEELGIDPGPRLMKLYEDILCEHPALLPQGGQPAAPALVTPALAPCTLPYDMSDFTGRQGELAGIFRHARKEHGLGTRIVAIDGMGGSGKTSLAVHAAHQLADAFPEGQLHIDLRGNASGQQPVSTVSALGTLLRALGVADESIPDDVAGRSGLWRTLLMGKRVLIILDDVSDPSAIQPLLPAGSGCLVLVTSRARLVDLDGAHWLSLDVMPPEDSRKLISQTLGAHRIAAEPEATEELARLCDHLPLALRVASARLGNRPRWTVQYMVERLRDETRRLDELSIGVRSVAATLRLSYQALDEDNRTTFRLLALHPGGGIDVHAAAAMLSTDLQHAEEALEHLVDVHLIEQPELGRYAFHDLVGSFARGLEGGAGSPDALAAVGRLLDYSLAATEDACRALFPGRRHIPNQRSSSPSETPEFKTVDRAGAWFTREQYFLLSAVRMAARRGYDRCTVHLARNVIFYLSAHGLLDDFGDMARTAVAAARRLGDDELLGISLANLGVALWEVGDFAKGIDVAQEARDLAARHGDAVTEAHCESTLGLYNSLLGRFPEALAHLERAIGRERELKLSRPESESLTILSTLYEQWGRYEEAAQAALRALELHKGLGWHENKLGVLLDLGFAQLGLGLHGEVEATLARARELCNGNRKAGIVAMALALSADNALALGERELSLAYMRQAQEHLLPSTSAVRTAKVKNMIGRVLHKHGEHQRAWDFHSEAYALASRMRYLTEEAYARLGMARVAEHLGDEGTAAVHRRASGELFATMGVPESRWRR